MIGGIIVIVIFGLILVGLILSFKKDKEPRDKEVNEEVK